MSKHQLIITDFILGFITALVLGYLLSKGFRSFISTQAIDPAIFAGLITLMALLATIRQNISLSKQSVRDRNFAYRLSVKSKFEEMGVVLVAKLLEIEARRNACIESVQGIKFCLDSGKVYRDGFNITSTESFNSDSCRASAALDIYFPSESEKWNETLTALNEMGSIASSILLTYVENDNGKLTIQLLADIDMHLTKIKELNAGIADKPKEIRDNVVEAINHHTMNLTRIHPL